MDAFNLEAIVGAREVEQQRKLQEERLFDTAELRPTEADEPVKTES